MNPQIASALCVLVILGLFALNRDRKAHTSRALWIAVVWFSIASSRPVSQWMQGAPREVDASALLLEGSPVDRNIQTCLIVMGLIVLVKRSRQVGKLLLANKPILIFTGFCAISILWSDYPFVTFKRWTRCVGDVLMVIVVLTDPDRSAAVKRLFTRTAFVLIPVSILLIKYYPDLGRGYGIHDDKPYWTGVATGKNSLGVLSLIAGLACLSFLFATYRERKNRHRIRSLAAQGTLLAMLLYLLLLANSKTSLCCFLMAGSLITVTHLCSVARKQGAIHVMVIVLLSVSVAVLFLGVGSGALEAMGRDATLTGRTEIWNVVFRFAGNPLVGVGFESFWLGKRYDETSRIDGVGGVIQAHNGYLEIYLTLGWIGLICLGLLIVTGYRNVLAACCSDRDIGILKLGYFVIALIYNLTEGSFKANTPVWLAFLLSAAAVPRLQSAKVRMVTGWTRFWRQGVRSATATDARVTGTCVLP